MKFKPYGERVLVEPITEEEQVKGGIFIPDSAKEKSQEGIVRAVGTGKKNDAGEVVPMNVKIGDKVLMPKYGGTEIKLDGKDYQIVREDDLLGCLVG